MPSSVSVRMMIMQFSKALLKITLLPYHRLLLLVGASTQSLVLGKRCKDFDVYRLGVGGDVLRPWTSRRFWSCPGMSLAPHA